MTRWNIFFFFLRLHLFSSVWDMDDHRRQSEMILRWKLRKIKDCRTHARAHWEQRFVSLAAVGGASNGGLLGCHIASYTSPSVLKETTVQTGKKPRNVLTQSTVKIQNALSKGQISFNECFIESLGSRTSFSWHTSTPRLT